MRPLIQPNLNKKALLELVFILFTVAGCVARADTQPAAAPGAGSGLEGSINLHGISAGPVIQGVPDFKPLANTAFEVKKGEATVATFTTDDQGRFRISLPPGQYSVTRKDWKSRVGFYGPFTVEITLGQMTKVEWRCQTGLQ